MGNQISTSTAEEISIPNWNPSSKTQESWNTLRKQKFGMLELPIWKFWSVKLRKMEEEMNGKGISFWG